MDLAPGAALRSQGYRPVVPEVAEYERSFGPGVKLGGWPLLIAQSLTANPGTWDGAPSAYTYQWQRCDAAGGSCVPIPGAIAEIYVVGTGDVGARLTVAVTAADSVTRATLAAAPTAVVR